MIHNDIQNQLQLLVKVAAPPLLEVSDSPVELPQFVPGQRVPAHVMAALPNGRFEVKVGDQILDMNLPRNTEPGEQLDLTFVGSKPRLTFALTSDLPGFTAPERNVSLSDTARFIGALLNKGEQMQAQAGQAGSAGQMAQAGRSERVYPPVLTAPPQDTAEFVLALKRSVTESGLFYESHQAGWVTGERPLFQLMREPQGQLPPLSAQVQAQAADDKGQAAAVPVRHDPVSPQVTDLVQKQLDVLDTRQIVWQGQVWPGQNMDWRIQEEGRQQSGGGEAEQQVWSSNMHLELPGLGAIDARLQLVAGKLAVTVSAADADAAARMGAQQQALLDRLAAAGLTVAAMQVGQNEDRR